MFLKRCCIRMSYKSDNRTKKKERNKTKKNLLSFTKFAHLAPRVSCFHSTLCPLNSIVFFFVALFGFWPVPLESTGLTLFGIFVMLACNQPSGDVKKASLFSCHFIVVDISVVHNTYLHCY